MNGVVASIQDVINVTCSQCTDFFCEIVLGMEDGLGNKEIDTGNKLVNFILIF